ncbi:MAG: class C sortase [Erysipelotrichaceae bacterium]|nr:class C sortase [Erysipelotrichaceae bacterium]
MNKKIHAIIFLTLFISGFFMLIYPNLKQQYGQAQIEQTIVSFQEEEKQYSQLYEQMQAYNEQIYLNHQSGLKDAWSFEHHDFYFSELNTDQDMIGYITIPKMNIELPLYIGATVDNMNKGASVLGQTSMPIGGMNTNCVIAAHRGMYTSAMFRDIELLKAGDVIVIHNPWQQLEYEVIKAIAIEPNDIDAIKILEGQDLITLMTCHPYPESYQRYVVYAQRKGAEKTEVPFAGVSYVSSQNQLQIERSLNQIGTIFFLVVFAILVIQFIMKRLHTNK